MHKELSYYIGSSIKLKQKNYFLFVPSFKSFMQVNLFEPLLCVLWYLQSHRRILKAIELFNHDYTHQSLLLKSGDIAISVFIFIISSFFTKLFSTLREASQ